MSHVNLEIYNLSEYIHYNSIRKKYSANSLIHNALTHHLLHKMRLF